MKESLILVHAIPMETRVALIEEGRLGELFIETEQEKPLVGNIIKGKVSRVLPGMQAAFVDIGLEKAGFLYVGDIVTREEFSELDEADEKPAIAVLPRIEDVIKEGQEILVQITKAPISTKGARLTNQLTLPGRYLVLSPNQVHIGVSRKVRFARERSRLRNLLKKLAPEGMGLIARTVAEGRSEEELQADRDYLIRLWNTVQNRAKKATPPTTVYNELTMSLRIIRDVLSDRYSKILVDNTQEYEKISRFLEAAIPKRTKDVSLYQGKRDILDVYGIGKQLDEALKPMVSLQSGGSIVIEETEALTSIDVNTGRFVGTSDLETTVLKTNLEAAEVICQQLRLRNIGGIIIIDFIDMDLAENRTKVYNALKDFLKQDRAKTSIQKISELGLVEMTRQRLKESLTRSIGLRCPTCHGRGYLTDPSKLIGNIYRQILQTVTQRRGVSQIIVKAHPWITDYLFAEAMPYLEALETQFNCWIRVIPDQSLAEEMFVVTEGKQPLVSA